MLKVFTVAGIRPDFINLSVLWQEFDKHKNEIEYTISHTNQHYSYELDKVFLDQLKIPKPDFFLDIKSGSQGYQTAETIHRSERYMLATKPDIDISFSDANTSLHAITAKKNHIKVAHIESGMRSFDSRMLEEYNRRIVDAISDIYFCPTEYAKRHLLDEGVKENKIHISGKLIVDVLERYKNEIDKSEITRALHYNFMKQGKEMELHKDNFFLCTLHRPENVENKENLSAIFRGLNLIYEKFEMPIVALLHPRTQGALERYKIEVSKGISIGGPIGFFDFAKLEKECKLAITDSGTVEEETLIFNKPCVTVRMSTEREETVDVGANKLAGNYDGTFDPEIILQGVKDMIDKKYWENPYQLGASKKITKTLIEKEEEIKKPKIWWDG